MLFSKSPPKPDVLRPRTRSAATAVRKALIWVSPLPTDLGAELQPAWRDVRRPYAECRRGANRRTDRLVLSAVGQVQRVEEHIEFHGAARQRELLLYTGIEQVDVGDAPLAAVRLQVDLYCRLEPERAQPHGARIDAAGLEP